MFDRSLDIPSGARVLEVGSGHNPHPRSTVLCDLHLEDHERGGRLRRDRPFVLADGGALPFPSRSFDFVIAAHSAEHASDLERFLEELMRVAPAGYLESPAAIGEELFGWRKHRWMLWLRDGVLYARPRGAERRFGSLFHEMMRREPQFAAVYYRYPDVFLVRCHWQGKIPYRILEAGDPDPIDLDDPVVLSRLLSERSSPAKWLRAYLSTGLRDPLWRGWRDLSSSLRRSIGRAL